MAETEEIFGNVRTVSINLTESIHYKLYTIRDAQFRNRTLSDVLQTLLNEALTNRMHPNAMTQFGILTILQDHRKRGFTCKCGHKTMDDIGFDTHLANVIVQQYKEAISSPV